MTTSAVPSYAGYRFPAEVISHAVWLYFRFPLSLRMVNELLAMRGIIVSYETVRQWAELAEGFAGAASGMVNGGAEVRAELLEPDPAQAACSRRQVALRRGRDHDLRGKTLAVARGGPERDGAGHPGAEPARHAGRQAPALQAAEEAGPPTARHDHGPDMVAIQRRFSFEVRQPVQWRRIQPRA